MHYSAMRRDNGPESRKDHRAWHPVFPCLFDWHICQWCSLVVIRFSDFISVNMTIFFVTVKQTLVQYHWCLPSVVSWCSCIMMSRWIVTMQGKYLLLLCITIDVHVALRHRAGTSAQVVFWSRFAEHRLDLCLLLLPKMMVSLLCVRVCVCFTWRSDK